MGPRVVSQSSVSESFRLDGSAPEAPSESEGIAFESGRCCCVSAGEVFMITERQCFADGGLPVAESVSKGIAFSSGRCCCLWKESVFGAGGSSWSARVDAQRIGGCPYAGGLRPPLT